MSVRVAVIGCGQWGQNYLRVLDTLPGCEVAVACDLSNSRLADIRTRNPALRTTSDIDSVIEDGSIDAVVVATPADEHYEVVRRALEAEKDCLVEKPMTIRADEARNLSATAASTHRILMVGHIFLYNPAIHYLQRLIVSGDIGNLEYLLFTRTNLGPIRSDVNVVWDLMTHDVSILMHLLHRSPSWVSALGGRYLRESCEDVAFATFGFDSGVVANMRASWLDPQKVREITVVGSRKMAVFNDLDPAAPVRVYDKGAIREPNYESFGEFKLVTRSGDVLMPAIPATEPLRNQCEHFVDCVVSRNQPLTDSKAGARVVETICAVNASMERRGAAVVIEDGRIPA